MKIKGKLMFSFVFLFIFSLCFVSSIFGAPEPTNKPSIKPSKHKVLILGAGMAGISAAKTLWDSKFEDFLVLEGSGRLGGRVFKDTIRDKFGRESKTVVELGANWVHGTKCNPIWDLVQRSGLNYYNTMNALTDGKYVILDENGKDVTAEDKHEYFAKVEECVESFEENSEKDISKRDSLRECGWDKERVKTMNPAMKAIEYYTFDFDAAIPPERISCGIELRSDGAIESEGDNQALVNDRRGYAKIIEDMAQEFGGKIEHNAVVEKIELINSGEIAVKVKGNNEAFIANHVLVTFSIGVLRKNTLFNPSLSDLQFGTALKKMEMANYLKIFMKFKTKFWPEKDYMFYAPQKDADRRLSPVWQNLPGKSNENKENVPENDNVMLITVTGEESWKMTEAKKAEIEGRLFKIFKKVFKVDAKALHMATHFKNWREDSLFLGAYSNPGIGMNSSDFDILTSPVKEFGNRLYFAGEGTSELYYGFLHGAYLTGIEQAKKIHAVLKFQEAQASLAANMLQRNLGTTRNGTMFI